MGTHALAATWSDSITIPEDGVTGRGASSVNVPVGGVGDNTKWLRDKLVGYSAVDIDNGEPPYGTLVDSITGSTNYVAIDGTGITFTGAKVGDILILDGTVTVAIENNTNADAIGKLRYHVWEDFAGTPVQTSGGFAMLWEGATTPGGGHIRVRTLPLHFQRTLTKDGTLHVTIDGAISDASEALAICHLSYTAALVRRAST